MHLYPLDTDVAIDVSKLPFEHLIALLLSMMILFAVVFINGFSFKWGEKEVIIGGIRRLMAKKDEDIRLKEDLKKFTDDVDHEVEANLYDLIEEMDARIERFALLEHCYFTFQKFNSIVKSELYKRVRRNNLRERLSLESREKYIEKLMRDIETRYELLQAKIAGVKCGDTYESFAVIRNNVQRELSYFFDQAVHIMIGGYKKKIEKYEKTKGRFRTNSARKFCCDDRIEKNKGYIESLLGEKPV
jgi:hypothetical protein